MAHQVIKPLITIQQDRVTLRYQDSFILFYWPFDSDYVMIGSCSWNHDLRRMDFDNVKLPVMYSVEEADEIFYSLYNAGAY